MNEKQNSGKLISYPGYDPGDDPENKDFTDLCDLLDVLPSTEEVLLHAMTPKQLDLLIADYYSGSARAQVRALRVLGIVPNDALLTKAKEEEGADAEFIKAARLAVMANPFPGSRRSKNNIAGLKEESGVAASPRVSSENENDNPSPKPAISSAPSD